MLGVPCWSYGIIITPKPGSSYEGFEGLWFQVSRGLAAVGFGFQRGLRADEEHEVVIG